MMSRYVVAAGHQSQQQGPPSQQRETVMTEKLHDAGFASSFEKD